MSINLFEANAGAPSGRRILFGNQGNPANTERPKAKLWLNIGYEAGGKFINLPVGLPVDNMDPADVRGQNVDWIKQRSAQNALLDAVKKHGFSLQPGEEQTLQLEVRIRRVNEEREVPQNENEYAVDLSALFKPSVLAAAE